MEPLVKKTHETLIRHAMVEPGDTVIVGVSGGADSVGMLLVLNDLADKFDLRLVVCHLDHSTRNGESGFDAEFVRSLASKLGLDYEGDRKDVPKLTRDAKSSFQETARNIRRDFLEAIRKKHDGQRIALGHTRDDQVETVLMNFLRGSGTRGMGGMRPVNDRLIRPLFYSSHEDILAFLDSRNVEYREDSSNSNTDYLRNRIRLDLIPTLRSEFNPNIQKNIFDASQIFQTHEDLLNQLGRKEFEGSGGREIEGQKVFLRLDKLKPLSPALQAQLVRQAYKEGKGDLKKLTFHHVQQVLKLLDDHGSGKSVSLPDDWVATRGENRLCFYKISEPKSRILNRTDQYLGGEYWLRVPGVTVLDEAGISLDSRLQSSDGKVSLAGSGERAFLDWNRTGPDLKVRFFRPGDRFRPLGMPGTKKVKDLLIDAKIPQRERKSLPLLTTAAGDIIWVYGVRISEDFKVTPQTTNMLIIEGLVNPR